MNTVLLIVIAILAVVIYYLYERTEDELAKSRQENDLLKTDLKHLKAHSDETHTLWRSEQDANKLLRATVEELEEEIRQLRK